MRPLGQSWVSWSRPFSQFSCRVTYSGFWCAEVSLYLPQFLMTAIFTVCRECLFTNLPQTCLNEHNISGQKNCIVIWYSRKSASNTFQNLYFFFWLVFEHTDYAVVNFSPESNRTEKPPTSKSVYTFATANTLLGVEIMGKFQNMDLVKIILSTWTFSFLLEFFNVTTLGVQY